MNDLKKAAQQALEALKACVKALDALHAPGDSIYTRASDLADRAEIALRAALAQQEQEPVAWYDGRKFYGSQEAASLDCANMAALMPLYTHPPSREPEQEPVAWMFQHEETKRMTYVSNDGCNGPGRFLVMNPRYALVCALYTTPPRRKWQGLTEEEREQATGWSVEHIEAALKEKNHE
jgi:hypothetical protein